MIDKAKVNTMAGDNADDQNQELLDRLRKSMAATIENSRKQPDDPFKEIQLIIRCEGTMETIRLNFRITADEITEMVESEKEAPT